MKLNIMKVAQRLKWAYLSEQEAQQKGATMETQTRVDYEVYNALKENANITEHFLKFGF